jgi:hypothetical protein|nr:MAG TPA: hypothetical protein [Bacteriophage sp.]
MNTDYTLTEEETARVEREVEKERNYLQAVRKCTDKEIEKMLRLVRKRAEQNIIYFKLKKKEGEERLRTARCEVVRESLVEAIDTTFKLLFPPENPESNRVKVLSESQIKFLVERTAAIITAYVHESVNKTEENQQ